MPRQCWHRIDVCKARYCYAGRAYAGKLVHNFVCASAMQAVQWSTFKSTLLRSGVVQASQLTVPNAWYDNPLFVTQVLNVSIHTNALKQQKKKEKREMKLRCNQWIDITIPLACDITYVAETQLDNRLASAARRTHRHAECRSQNREHSERDQL